MFISGFFVILWICKSINGIANNQEGIAGIATEEAISWSFNFKLFISFLTTQPKLVISLYSYSQQSFRSTLTGWFSRCPFTPYQYLNLNWNLCYSRGNSPISTCNEATGEDLNAPQQIHKAWFCITSIFLINVLFAELYTTLP